MVCVPCVLIPLFLFLWRFIQPFVLRFWNPFEKKGENDNKPKDITECSLFSSCPCLKKDKDKETNESSKEVLVDDKKEN